jgi:hypothetical protein
MQIILTVVRITLAKTNLLLLPTKIAHFLINTMKMITSIMTALISRAKIYGKLTLRLTTRATQILIQWRTMSLGNQKKTVLLTPTTIINKKTTHTVLMPQLGTIQAIRKKKKGRLTLIRISRRAVITLGPSRARTRETVIK